MLRYTEGHWRLEGKSWPLLITLNQLSKHSYIACLSRKPGFAGGMWPLWRWSDSAMSPEGVAEAVRFELTNGCPLPVFKTGAIDHSATLP